MTGTTLTLEEAVASAATGDLWLFRGRSFADLAIRIDPSAVAGDGLAVRSDLPYAEAKALVLHELERRYVADLLARTGGNLSAASRDSGIDRKQLRTIARRHGLVDGPDED